MNWLYTKEQITLLQNLRRQNWTLDAVDPDAALLIGDGLVMQTGDTTQSVFALTTTGQIIAGANHNPAQAFAECQIRDVPYSISIYMSDALPPGSLFVVRWVVRSNGAVVQEGIGQSMRTGWQRAFEVIKP